MSSFHDASGLKPRFCQQTGFSLVEMIVVAAIIVALATAVIVKVQGRREQAKLAKVASTARLINEAASVYYMEHGVWPLDQNNSVVPPEIESVLPRNLFTTDVDIGGRWDWNGPGSGLEKIGVSVRYPTIDAANLDVLLQLDQLIDDGNLSTGRARVFDYAGKRHFWFALEEL